MEIDYKKAAAQANERAERGATEEEVTKYKMHFLRMIESGGRVGRIGLIRYVTYLLESAFMFPAHVSGQVNYCIANAARIVNRIVADTYRIDKEESVSVLWALSRLSNDDWKSMAIGEPWTLFGDGIGSAEYNELYEDVE